MAKTSLSLPDDTLPLAHQHAEAAGMTLSAWIDKAIRDLAADEDAQQYDEWRSTWTDDERAAQDAFDNAPWTAVDDAAGAA